MSLFDTGSQDILGNISEAMDVIVLHPLKTSYHSSKLKQWQSVAQLKFPIGELVAWYILLNAGVLRYSHDCTLWQGDKI